MALGMYIFCYLVVSVSAFIWCPIAQDHELKTLNPKPQGSCCSRLHSVHYHMIQWGRTLDAKNPA